MRNLTHPRAGEDALLVAIPFAIGGTVGIDADLQAQASTVADGLDLIENLQF